MRKLSLLIALCMLISIGGVYATWVYTNTTDVADETMNKAVSMSGVTYEGSYGTFTVNVDGVTVKVDPKPGTTHDTGLKIEGEVVFTFVPATYAPQDVKDNAVGATFSVHLSNKEWKYGDNLIFQINPYDSDVQWDKQTDGSFKFVLDAAELAKIIKINVFTLDTKVKYDEFDKALEAGLIVFGISDGTSATTN